jgi:hypothetical protein
VRRQDLLVLTHHQRMHLETGGCWFPGAAFDGDRESFEDAWDIHREAILAEFIARRPCRRPFAWWLCDHRQERPIVSTWATQRQIEAMRNENRRTMMFGFLHTRTLGMDGEGRWMELQEPEEEYLERLGLLSQAELDALAARGRGEHESLSEWWV